MGETLKAAELEDTLYRIIDGKIEYDGFITRDPILSIKSAGKKVYNYILKQCLEDPAFFTDRDIYMMLLSTKQWSQKQEEELKKLPKVIENNKLDYYNDFFISERKRTRKIVLDENTSKYMLLVHTRHKYDSLLPSGIANGAMWNEMICRMHNGPNKLGALSDYHNRYISDIILREIAVSNEWGSFSNISKNPLGKSPIKMTDLQRRLYSWTNVYRNVRTHPDCPADSIIDDHDAFDGWMIDQNRKERAKKATQVQIKGIKPNAQNVYIMTKTKEGAEDVLSLNDGIARSKMEALFNKVDEGNKNKILSTESKV
jgi:hypothetical protein